MKDMLRTLAGCGRVRITVLSGRTLSDVRKRVGIRGIFYGGNHGIEISGPDIRFTHGEARAARALIVKAKRRLEGVLRPFEGAWLEDKKYTLSLHFRCVRNENVAAVKRIFSDTVSELIGNSSQGVMKGKKVLELMPVASWNKGKAALLILDHHGKNCLPVMIGDDVTDETAFEALGERGITVRVGRGVKTSAQYYVANQGEVARVLESIYDGVNKL